MDAKQMKRLSNTEFIEHVMEFSKHGALMQAFILQGLEKYSAAVVTDKEQLCINLENGYISGPAWVSCAEELHGLMAERLGMT